MIRPANFGFNAETATSNSFQTEDGNIAAAEIAKKAIKEFDDVLAELLRRNVDVFAVEDTPEPVKPDAVFPNNWISFHEQFPGYSIRCVTKSRPVTADHKRYKKTKRRSHKLIGK